MQQGRILEFQIQDPKGTQRYICFVHGEEVYDIWKGDMPVPADPKAPRPEDNRPCYYYVEDNSLGTMAYVKSLIENGTPYQERTIKDMRGETDY